MKNVLPFLMILLTPLAVGASATSLEAERCVDGACIACPYGGSTEPSAHDCQASGGYVVGSPDCDDGGCAGLSTCVCCEWYRNRGE